MNNETKNNIKIVLFLFVIFVILYALHITFGDRFADQYDNSNYEGETQIIFSIDTANKTLTVKEIYSDGGTVYWPEVTVNNGSATLPSGTIDLGDVITDCDGYLVLVWSDTGNHLFSIDFN